MFGSGAPGTETLTITRIGLCFEISVVCFIPYKTKKMMPTYKKGSEYVNMYPGPCRLGSFFGFPESISGFSSKALSCLVFKLGASPCYSGETSQKKQETAEIENRNAKRRKTQRERKGKKHLPGAQGLGLNRQDRIDRPRPRLTSLRQSGLGLWTFMGEGNT